MPKRTETTTPDTPPTERTLPPGGSAAPVARTGQKSVSPPSRSERPAGERVSERPSAQDFARRRAGGNGRPGGPAEMRREIERTRARMSSTLDAVEARIAHERDSLERKKDDLVDRATLKGLRHKLRREPWRSMAIAFVAGYVIAAIRD